MGTRSGASTFSRAAAKPLALTARRAFWNTPWKSPNPRQESRAPVPPQTRLRLVQAAPPRPSSRSWIPGSPRCSCSLHPQLSCRHSAQPYLGPDLSRGGYFADQLLGSLLLSFTVGRIFSRSRSGGGNGAGPSSRSSRDSRRVVLAACSGHPLRFLWGTQQSPEGLWSTAGLFPRIQAPRLAGAIFRAAGLRGPGTTHRPCRDRGFLWARLTAAHPNLGCSGVADPRYHQHRNERMKVAMRLGQPSSYSF